ncbi:MAG: DUF3806 domain-containing protein [Pseudomonadota bacterium]
MQIRQLTPHEFAALVDALDLARRLVDRALDTDAVQELYDSLVGMNERPHHVTIATGLAFGQLIIEASEFEWARIKDEYGEETCIAVKDTELICAPISMIQKRLDQNEKLRISDLVDGTVQTMNNKAASADYRPK